MNRINLTGMALVALVAFGAFGVSSAFALTFELAEWLVAGSVVTKEVATLAEGELLLEDKTLKGSVSCSGYLDGAVGTELANLSNIEVTKVLNLSEKEVLELSGEALLCKADSGSACEESTTDIELYPIHLPWLLEAELDVQEATPWVLVISGTGGLPGYELSCLSAGIKVTDTCTAAEGSGNEVTNAAGGVATAAGTTIEPLGTCALGGAESGVVEAAVAGLISSSSGVLSISTASEVGLTFELAEWLVGGAAVVKETATLAEGELLLEDKTEKSAITCSGYLDGAVGTELTNLSNMKITKILNLSEVEIPELSGEALLCKADSGSACEENATDIELNPVHLPWLLEAELDVQEATPWVLVVSGTGGLPGYELSCLTAGIKVTDTCTAVENSGNRVVNAATGVEIPTGTTIEPLGTCTLGGAGSNVVEAAVAGLVTAPGSGVLSISTP